MPKNKSHKGTLKRIRLTGTGKIKMQRACGRHLRSHKTGSQIRKYRLPAYVQGGDAQRLRHLLGLKAPKRKPEPASSST